MAFLAGRMIWEFGYRRSKMEKIYRRIRTVYTTANTGLDFVFVLWPSRLCQSRLAEYKSAMFRDFSIRVFAL